MNKCTTQHTLGPNVNKWAFMRKINHCSVRLSCWRLILRKRVWYVWNSIFQNSKFFFLYFANLRTFSLFYHHDWLIAFNQTSNWCNFWNIRTCSHFSLWSKERHLFVTPMWFLEQIVPIWANAGRKVVHPLNLSLDPIYFQVKKLVKGYIFLELETLSIHT